MLPARLKLPVPGSDHQDFTTDILLGQSNLQVDAFPFLVVWLRFILICLNDLYFYLSRLLASIWSAKNVKQWDDREEQNCWQDYKTFPLLTTGKSVIIEDPHGVKKNMGRIGRLHKTIN